MATNVQFMVHISDRKITNRSAVSEGFRGLPDGSFMVKIESAKLRTLSQNAYYHGCVVPMVKDGLRAAGFDDVKTNYDAHLVMKALFLKKHFINPSTGEAIEWIDSTTKLSTVEFNLFLEQVWKWASEYLGIVIPEPNSQLSLY